jgi:hypothetical protein
MTPLGVLDLLGLCGFDRHGRAKLVRHKEGKYPVEELLRNGWLDRDGAGARTGATGHPPCSATGGGRANAAEA